MFRRFILPNRWLWRILQAWLCALACTWVEWLDRSSDSPTARLTCKCHHRSPFQQVSNRKSHSVRWQPRSFEVLTKVYCWRLKALSSENIGRSVILRLSRRLSPRYCLRRLAMGPLLMAPDEKSVEYACECWRRFPVKARECLELEFYMPVRGPFA